MDKEKIKALKDRFGEITEVTTDKGIFLFRKPGRIEIKKFYDTVTRSVYDASYGICVDTVVSPSPEDLQRAEEATPGLVMILAGEIQNFFSAPSRVSSRKL